MSSNEEYLDKLLQSMGDEGADFSDDGENFSADIEAMYEELQKSGEMLEESEENTDVPSAEQGESEIEDMSELLNSLDMPEIEEITEVLENPEVTELMDGGEEVQAEDLLIEENPSENAPEEEESSLTVESTQDMSQDEIESMLAAFANEEVTEDNISEAVSEEKDFTEDTPMENPLSEVASGEAGFMESTSEEMPPMDKEEEDILALLGSIQDDASVEEINELLSKAENNEAVDESIFTEEDAKAVSTQIAAMLGEGIAGEESQGEDEKTDKKKKKEKKEKVKKVKAKKEQDGEEKAPKEPGFFGKIFSKLTEEDEPEPISEENQNIMKELEAEDAAEAGKDKKIKQGLMPGQKDGGEGEDSGKKSKKGNKKEKKPKKEKPKKESKPKKEKPKKEPAVPEKPGKKISKASMIVIVLFAGTIFGIVYFASTFLSGILQKQHAKDAFAKQDYLTCYEQLYGQNLSEEEDMMFHHARTVLKVERRLIRYENYLDDYQILEALDTLMQALRDYDDLYAEAQSYGAEAEVNAYYARIYEILERDYGLNRESAHAIAACTNKVDYTRYLTALAAGEQISVNGSEGGLTLPEMEMQDVLPAEEELLPPAFMN